MVALVVTPILFQKLGEEVYGLIALGLSVTLLFGILVNYGFHLNGPKELALRAKGSEENKALINEVITTRLILATLLSFVIYFSIEIFGLFPKYDLIMQYALIILFAEALFPMFIAQGFEKLQLISRSNMAAKILYLVLIVLFVKGPEDAPWVNFYFGLSTLIANVVLLLIIYRLENLKFYIASLNRILFRLKDNFQYFVSTPASYIIVSGGIIILSAFVTEKALGQYALAQRIALLIRMLPGLYGQSILQKATRLEMDSKESYQVFLKQNHRIGLVVCGLIGLGVFLTAPFIIRVVGGEFVTESAQVLKVLGFLPFAAMFNIKNTVDTIIQEKKQVLSKALWIATLAMLVLTTIGSYYWGGIGLAYALLATEIINYLVHSYLLRRTKNSLTISMEV